jgi:hypothetical protein
VSQVDIEGLVLNGVFYFGSKGFGIGIVPLFLKEVLMAFHYYVGVAGSKKGTHQKAGKQTADYKKCWGRGCLH